MIKSEELIQEYLRLLNQASDDDEFNTLEFVGNITYTEGFNAYCGALTDHVEKYFGRNKASEEELGKKQEIMKEFEQGLEDVVFNEPIKNREYNLFGTVPFGTGAEWGLGMKGDDLDMTIFVGPKLDPDNAQIEKLVRARTKAIFQKIYQRIVKKKMMGGRRFQNIRMDYRSDFPKLTGMIDEFKFEIRVLFTDAVTPKYINAEMIEAYGKFDNRFILLAIAVQKLHRSKKTTGNEKYWRTVFPNGITTVMMVLVFMKHFNLLPNIKEKRNGREFSDKAVEKWKKNNECKVEVGTLFLMFLHFYGNTVWDDSRECFGKTLNVADGSLIDNPSYEPSIEIVDDSEDKRYRATYDVKLSEYINQILMTQAILRNNPPPGHVAELFDEPLIPRMSFAMRPPFVPFNDDPEYDSEDDAKTRKRKAERKKKREEKEKRREERRAQGIEDDEDEEEEDSEEEEAPARKLRKRKGSQRGVY